MKYIQLIIVLFLFSCNTDDFNTPDCMEENCAILNDYDVLAIRDNESVTLRAFNNKIIDGLGKVCFPDALDFYISEDNVEFDLLGRNKTEDSEFLVSSLVNDKPYYFRMVSLHCELDSIVSHTLYVKPGEKNFPIPLNKSFPLKIDEIQISNNNEHIIYQSTDRSWWLTSNDNPDRGEYLFEESFEALWLSDDTRIAYVKLIREGIYIRSHKLNVFDISSKKERTLHTIQIPGEYAISSIEASTDGEHLYFRSSKDNGASTRKDSSVYTNIWKIHVETGDMEKLTDFLPVDFDLQDYKEDPQQPGNFYVLGGPYLDYASERIFDLFYWNQADHTFTPILEDEFQEKYLLVSPGGDKVLLSSERSGITEIWIYDLNTSNLYQLTDRLSYGEKVSWINFIWKDNSTLLGYLKYNGVWQFVEFEV